MKNLGKIIGINLGILLAYTLVFFLFSYNGSSSGDGYAGMGFAFGMMAAIAVHALVNLIIMIVKFVQGQREVGLSYLTSMFVVAIVGFSSCLGGSSLF